MENKFKLRISRMFRSSFGSCRSRNLTDIIGKPLFISQSDHNLDVIDPILSNKIKPYPSICKPRCPITSQELVHNTCIIAKEALARQKVSGKYSLFHSGDHVGRTCPPSSPNSKIKTFDHFNDFQSGKKGGRFRKKSKRMGRTQKIKKQSTWFSSEKENDDDNETEDFETETLFSLKSFSSDTSKSRRDNHLRRRGSSKTGRRRVGKKESEVGKLLPLKDSFAVVKRSSDPYGDFRTSMVEMIVERQIFSAKDLEQLLQCFLSLNSDHHHKIIVEVFMEIWEALFCNWS